MSRRTLVRFSPMTGLDLSTAKIRIENGASQRSENFDYEQPPGARLRFGYARLLAADGSTVIKTTNTPSRVAAFERDDGVVRLVIAHGGSVEEQEPGSTEW